MTKENKFEEVLFCVKKKGEMSFLNYASKRRMVFRKGTHYRLIESPFPTLRPKEHTKYFHKWMGNTPNPEEYEIVEYKLLGRKK